MRDNNALFVLYFESLTCYAKHENFFRANKYKLNRNFETDSHMNLVETNIKT